MQMQKCSHSRCFIASFKLTLNVLTDEISTASLRSLLHHLVALSVRQHSLWSWVFLLYLLLLVFFWQNDSPSSLELLLSSSCHTSLSHHLCCYMCFSFYSCLVRQTSTPFNNKCFFPSQYLWILEIIKIWYFLYELLYNKWDILRK